MLKNRLLFERQTSLIFFFGKYRFKVKTVHYQSNFRLLNLVFRFKLPKFVKKIMARRDNTHEIVKAALIREGWIITNDNDENTPLKWIK